LSFFEKSKKKGGDEYLQNFGASVSAFEYNPGGKYKRAFDYLFSQFIFTLRLKVLQLVADTQVCRIEGHAFIKPGYLHTNGGKDEIFEARPVTCVRKHSDGSVSLSSDPGAQGDLDKDTILEWLTVWKKNAVGLVLQCLVDSVYIVFMFSSDSRQVFLWRYDHHTSRVSVCSDDFSCKGNMCSSCGRVIVHDRCICRTLETYKPYYKLEYDNGEIYNVAYRKKQVVYLYISSKKKYYPMEIYDICGFILTLRRIFAYSKLPVHVHFLDKNLKVPLHGESQICDIQITEYYAGSNHCQNFYTQQREEAVYLATQTNIRCQKCGRGPKREKCGCNFCGTSQFGITIRPFLDLNDVHDKKVAGDSEERDLLTSFSCSVQSTYDKFLKLYQVKNQGLKKKDLKGVDNYHEEYKMAVVLFSKMFQNLKKFDGVYYFDYNGIIKYPSDVLVNCINSLNTQKEKIQGNLEMKNIHYFKRLSAWVQDGSSLQALKKKEMEETWTSTEVKKVSKYIEKMKSFYAPLSKKMEEKYIFSELHNTYYPFRSFQEPLKGQICHGEIQTTLHGKKVRILYSFSRLQKFQNCNCAEEFQSDLERKCQNSGNKDFRFENKNGILNENCYCIGPTTGICTSTVNKIKRFLSTEVTIYQEYSVEWSSYRILFHIHRLFHTDELKTSLPFQVFILSMLFFFSLCKFDTDTNWFELFNMTDYFSLVKSFYKIRNDDSCKNYKYFQYCGPLSKKSRRDSTYDEIGDEELLDLVDGAFKSVKAFIPFNNRYEKCSAAIKNNTERVWEELVKMCETSQNCRNKEDFLAILWAYEMDRSTFCPPTLNIPVLCDNSDCTQCKVFDILLKILSRRDDLVRVRYLKSVVDNADEQLRVFGEIVCTGICPHEKYFSRCNICVSNMKTCRKDELCLKDNDGNFYCDNKKIVSFLMSDGSSVLYEPKVDLCMCLRYYNTFRVGGKAPFVERQKCIEFNFFDPGFCYECVS
jgi:hypothetical protein